MRQPKYLQIKNDRVYTFLRRLEGREGIESLSLNISGNFSFQWIMNPGDSVLMIMIMGSSIREEVARELTEEITISRANGYTVVMLETPLDSESRPDHSKTIDRKFLPLGRKR